MASNSPFIFLAYWSGYPPVETTQKILDQFVADATAFPSTYYISLPFSLCLSLMEKYKDTSVILGADALLSMAKESFTEPIAVRLLAESKVPFVVLGDTAQRTTHPDSYNILSSAMHKLLQHEITPFICFGESLDDHKQGRSKSVLTAELTELLKDISPHLLMKIHLVYEASWAHQLTYRPSLDELTASYQMCREILQEQAGIQLGNEISLLGGIPYDLEDLNLLRKQSPINGFYFHNAGLNKEKIHEWLTNFKNETTTPELKNLPQSDFDKTAEISPEIK